MVYLLTGGQHEAVMNEMSKADKALQAAADIMNAQSDIYKSIIVCTTADIDEIRQALRKYINQFNNYDLRGN